MNARRTDLHRSGFTLLEILIVVALLGVVAFKVMSILRVSNAYVARETSSLAIEDHARIVMDRICESLVASDRESLVPIIDPNDSSSITFQTSLGWEEGEIVWGAPIRIGLDPDDRSKLVWYEAPDTPDEMSVVWSKSVRDLLEGEALNGIDDNDNDLVDESGLSFLVESNLITVRLSLGTVVEDGEERTSSIVRTLSIRNHPLGGS